MPDATDWEVPVKAAEKRLKDTERRLRGLTDSIPHAIPSAMGPLMRRIGEEEEARIALVAEVARVTSERDRAKWRPTADEMMAALSRFAMLWSVLTNPERAELLSAAVERCQVTAKDAAEVTLLPGFTDLVESREAGLERNYPKGTVSALRSNLRVPIPLQLKAPRRGKGTPDAA